MTTTYTSSDLRRTVLAIACTVVFSSTMLVAAVGPATAGSAPLAFAANSPA